MAVKCPTCHSENPGTVKLCGECGTRLDFLTPGNSSSEGDRAAFTKTFGTGSDELGRGALFAGRYEIIEELGKGGMGRVYRVEDKKIKAEIALKLIRSDISMERKTIERFGNELKLTRMISRRNVRRMFDIGEDKGTFFITMEGVENKGFPWQNAPFQGLPDFEEITKFSIVFAFVGPALGPVLEPLAASARIHFRS